jgi:hypothetical protein
MPFDMPLVSFELEQLAWPIMKLTLEWERERVREREQEHKALLPQAL